MTKRLIKLTKTEAFKKSIPCYVNPDHIIRMEPWSSKTDIFFSDGSTMLVEEDPDYICRLILGVAV